MIDVRPYLTVVVTARNDDHGGNLLGRMQAFVNGLLGQCNRHELPAELIVVEWNPPPDRPPLVDVLRWPAERGFCQVRIIEVTNEHHMRLPKSSALPLYQMIAKNVGIRRARGEFVLATNIDILFNDELMRFIAERRLEPGKMYRIDRWDAMPDVPVDAPVDEQLAYCASHLIRLNAREGTFRVRSDGQRILESNDIASADSGLALGSGWFPREMSADAPFRWVENDAELIIPPSSDQDRVLVLDVEPGPGVNNEPFRLELQNEAEARVSSVWVKRRSIVTFAIPPSSQGAIHLRLHVKRGGTKIVSDPRTLNFRVFRCDLDTATGVARFMAGKQSAAAVRTSQSWGARAARGIRIARDIWRGKPDVQIRVPMSPRKLAQLQLSQDGGGVSFSAEPLRGLFRRWTRNGSPSEIEILSPGLRVIWGGSWYPIESHRGETFRWTRNGGTMLLVHPAGRECSLSMLVEPGPAIGFEPFELQIRDQWGVTFVTAPINGRTEVNVPLPPRAGTLVLSLHAEGGGQPRILPGDPRTMVFRLFRCHLKGEVTAVTENMAPAEVGQAGSGIWSVHGWAGHGLQDGKRMIAASKEAEIVARVPEGPTRRLILGVEPGPAAGDEPFELAVLDSRDQVLCRKRIDGRQTVQIPNTLLSGNYYPLRLRVEGIDDAREPEAPFLLLSSLSWAGERGEEPVHVFVDPSAGSGDTSSGTSPIHLHTNACGDFTLMALHHWIDLRGYLELDLFSMNIDSVFCWAAHHGGAPEEILPEPMRIYHIEHGSGSGWTPEGQVKLFERIAAKGLSWLNYEEVLQWARIMRRFNAPMIFNHEDWGMAADELRETGPWLGEVRAQAVTPREDAAC